MLRNTKWLAVVALLGLTHAGVTQAATVSFSNIVDGDGLPSLFDVGATIPDPTDGNKLIIGLNNFSADGGSGTTMSAVDTISLTIVAPTGYVITSVGYTEGGNGATTNGVAAASGSIVADHMPTNFLTQLFQPGLSSAWTITPTATTINNKSSIDVSITNSLFAFAFAPGDIAQIAKTSATLAVGIEPVPLPPAVWLFGSALIGFVTYSRRRLS